MKLRYKTIPRAASAALNEANLSFLDELTRPAEVTIGSSPKRLIKPHAHYYLGLLPIINGQGLECATQIGWRHVLEGTDSFIEVAVEYISPRKFRAPVLTHIPKNASGLLAHLNLHVRKKAKGKGHEHFDVRTVSVPPLVTLAVWLAGPDKSMVLPVHSIVRSLPPGKTFSEKSFLQHLQRPAREILESEPEAYSHGLKQSDTEHKSSRITKIRKSKRLRKERI